MVTSVAGSSSLASFAISSALLFPSISISPGAHDTSMLVLVLPSRNPSAISISFCDIPIEVNNVILSENSMILGCGWFSLGGLQLLLPFLPV